jgi:uncharacterized protein YecE (DUF72 family)
MAEVRIGTSGYSYPHWRQDVFYPSGLKKAEELAYYSRYFSTVELNNPFYQLPKEETFISWREKVPSDFLFSVKASRFLTHFKKMKDGAPSWELFLSRAINLNSKLGPILFQFPANFPKDEKRLSDFLKMLNKYSSINNLRFAFEFRHPSWFSEDIYSLLEKHSQVSLVFADSVKWPKVEKGIGSFFYLRLHGPSSLYNSSYSLRQLKEIAGIIKKHLQEKRDVFAYFNNDGGGWAVKNALELKEIIEKRGGS